MKSTLLRPAQMPRKTGDGWFDKKSLVANLFAQELELLICTLGCAYGANSIKLPSWSSSDAGRGLTFQTRLSASSGVWFSPGYPGRVEFADCYRPRGARKASRFVRTR